VSISEIIPAEAVVRSPRRPKAAAPLPTLPPIAPGQLWLVEAPAAHGAPSAPARHAVDGVNVVVYDRPLAPLLADILPLGSYAEPAPTSGSGEAVARRCVGFARDGWSVARLLPRLPQRERLSRVRELVAALGAAKVPGGSCVTVLAEAGDGIGEEAHTSLDRLADTVATYARDTRLAIVIDAFGRGAASPSVVVNNGLAG
jgi:hypothetical protein